MLAWRLLGILVVSMIGRLVPTLVCALAAWSCNSSGLRTQTVRDAGASGGSLASSGTGGATGTGGRTFATSTTGTGGSTSSTTAPGTQTTGGPDAAPDRPCAECTADVREAGSAMDQSDAIPPADGRDSPIDTSKLGPDGGDSRPATDTLGARDVPSTMGGTGGSSSTGGRTGSGGAVGTGGTTADAATATGSGGAAGQTGGLDGSADKCPGALPLNCREQLAHSTLVQGRANLWSSYPTTQRLVSGRETLYVLRPDELLVVLTLTNLTADLDAFLLTSCDPSSAIKPLSTTSSSPTEKMVVFEVKIGQPYVVVVDGYDGAAGSYTLQVGCTY
jgi:hypothetical protein